MKQPLISIVTPCYNHGIYLDEAIKSIEAVKTPYSYEHIIINDGSTDDFTIKKLSELEAKGHCIIHQDNQGLAAARNNGIALAKGKYIVPLDSDNKLHENYLVKAIEILENNDKFDIVYGNSFFFENQSGLFKPGEFNIAKIMSNNYIDACAVYRKEVWLKTTGYDANMPVMGNEDWEFWINAFFLSSNFFYLNEICFYYRVTKASMRLTVTKDGFSPNKDYILKKHIDSILKLLADTHKKLRYIKTNRLKAAAKIVLGKMDLG